MHRRPDAERQSSEGRGKSPIAEGYGSKERDHLLGSEMMGPLYSFCPSQMRTFIA